ncbi:MAG: pyridoxamine 5'-phosphate oxidase family protein [Mogibacterium sp.]|nr:pyridoxamine 5'-phosphate oxidase family protein [Mogibacterium sp.]
MFRKMRRFKQLLSEEETRAVLEQGKTGVLAVSGDDGYPYAVPINYVYADGCIYFHSAKAGHKIDAIRADEKVSFCVIAEDRIVPEEVTTYFKSAIAFGRARILAGDEKYAAAMRLAGKYSSDYPEVVEEDMRKNFNSMEMVEIRIEHVTGKQAIELVRAAQAAQ